MCYIKKQIYIIRSFANKISNLKIRHPQLIFTFLKSAIEPLEKEVKYAQS